MNIVNRKQKFEDLAIECGLKKELVDEKIIPILDIWGFFEAPASTKYHGNYEGGLFDHSYEMTKSLIELTEKLDLTWLSDVSPFVVGMFHDLCKCDTYYKGVDGWYYADGTIPGHGDKSVIKAMQIFPLNEEEIHCIRWHMGAYETDTKMWNIYGRAVEKYPNVLWTHTADMMASKLKGI